MNEGEAASIVMALLSVAREAETIEHLNLLVDMMSVEELAGVAAVSLRRPPTLEELEFAERAWAGIISREGDRLMGVTQPGGNRAA